MTHSLFPSLWNEKNKDDNVLASLHREVDRLFEELSRGGHWPFRGIAANNGKIAPRIDISETDKEIEVTADLPGVDEKDIDVKLVDEILTIKGEKKSEVEKTEKDFHLVERSYGSFERSTRLPSEVDADKVKAVFKQGVLKITLPKTHSEKSKLRKIAISAQ